MMIIYNRLGNLFPLIMHDKKLIFQDKYAKITRRPCYYCTVLHDHCPSVYPERQLDDFGKNGIPAVWLTAQMSDL
jgi:hypothetical protein